MKKFLLCLSLFLVSTYSFAKNIVITSIQPLYSLTSYLTEGTDIEVHNAFGSDVSMTMSKDAIREKDFDLSVAKKAQAVIDIAKVWNDDIIYSKARMNNIRIIEIDASHPYDEKISALFFNEYNNGKTNYFVWLGSKNAIRMANIIARDLMKIYPKYKDKIEKNVNKFTKRMLEEEQKANAALLKVNSLEVISLSENIRYFLNDMNIYADYENQEKITVESIAQIIKEKGINIFVSDRWLKKDIIKAIREAGGEFVIINTLDIAYDLNGKMDPDAIIKAYKENSENLIKALSK